MSLRDVTMNVEDGSLGNQSSTGENVHVKIGVSAVKSDTPLLITAAMKPEQIKEKIGLTERRNSTVFRWNRKRRARPEK